MAKATAPDIPSQFLSINAGSSSIKFALYGPEASAPPRCTGAITGIGDQAARFSVQGEDGAFSRHFPIPERVTAVSVLLEWLAEHVAADAIRAVAHRVVHGGPDYHATQIITPALLGALYDAMGSDPEHLPQEIHLIESLQRQYPDAVHIACFDSAFHAPMPAVAAMLPIPHRYYSAGVRRFGYHGLSCAWMMRELRRVAGPAAAAGKVVLAHLGGGASVTAVWQGVSRDTTMGLTPAGGIPMGKRSGDIDPGLAWHCARHEQMTQAQFNHMVNHESGLLGVSGRSADLRVLLEHEADDRRCADAVALFLYQARKAVCAMAGAIDGMDTLVFSGGIGENAPAVRARLCAALTHLGVVLDPALNSEGAAVISAPDSKVAVHVVRSDEQRMLADEARALLGTGMAP